MTDDRNPTENAEEVSAREHAEDLRDRLAAGTAPAGRLLGLPDLGEDAWVDIAGVTALTGYPPKTITGWLSRGGPKTFPFPPASRILYRLYWPASVIRDWHRAYRAALRARVRLVRDRAARD